MKTVTLGTTGIKTPQNAFGALPIQRVGLEQAVAILRRAYEGGMTFFDTARAYSDSEEKLGAAFADMREKIVIASKTMGHTPEKFREDLNTSLANLKTDYIDIYQFHCADTVYRTPCPVCICPSMKPGRVPYIVNRTGDGMCPMEKSVLEEKDPQQAYQILLETRQKLMQNSK